ncbi:uncharacterized protein STEHIDRAFT_156694 [Stereum hirsutum FP-91666 SS1]|uniref:uncharacterized protein n=1 Tax=Stereum hirsutum (strain FP-91666) TaxID=721885 RepID=UPI000440ADBA|nr:uncharacterized protein STEHIDRAFT_156694 [Stereum hirsutum FP-91666 SS1]EIM86370.1 hypothetical protein STEHIDRAFT_156694 [Stereum hirsutum FP-91666 SS1]
MSDKNDPKAQWEQVKASLLTMTLSNVQLGSCLDAFKDMDNAVLKQGPDPGRELAKKWHAAKAVFATFVANNLAPGVYNDAIAGMDKIVNGTT